MSKLGPLLVDPRPLKSPVVASNFVFELPKNLNDASIALSQPFQGAARVITVAGKPRSSEELINYFEASENDVSRDLQASLFQNRAVLKVATSRVAMHLKPAERANIFRSIDRLLDLDHWEDESSQISHASFRTFLRFTIFAHPGRLPNLGVGMGGTVLAGWRRESRSVHAEFLSDDQCMALLRTESDRGVERTAWKGHVARLLDIIEANGARDCLE